MTVPVTLTAGPQRLTVLFDTGAVNLASVKAVSGAASPPPSPGLTPYTGAPAAIPGTIPAANFDNGGEGTAYHDATAANLGGAYRPTGVDLAASAEGGYCVGWTEADEWLNYTVTVASAGSYTAQLRVASVGGATLHVGFNGSGVWTAVTIPNTGGWQTWTTVTVPLTLSAGPQVLTVQFDTAGANLSAIGVTAGSSSVTPPSTPPPPPPSTPPTSSATLRVMQWNVQSGRDINGTYNPMAQVQLMASQRPDVICLDEVETWMADEPTLFKTYLEQVTGETWYAFYAPNTPNAGTIGDLLLSRFPIAQQNITTLTANPGNPSDYLGNRAALRALIYINNIPVNIIGTHLEYSNASYRTTQLNQLLPWAASFGGPRLMAGDFNSWWGEQWPVAVMQTYSDTWQDVTGSKENGYTIGNVRYDYIFRANDQNWRVTPTNAWVVSTTLSDHRPVVADFKVQ